MLWRREPEARALQLTWCQGIVTPGCICSMATARVVVLKSQHAQESPGGLANI